MDRRQAEALARLHRLAEMKKEAALARFAAVAQSRARLKASVEAHRKTEEPLGAVGQPTDPAMMKAALAHRRWSDATVRRLNQQLALVSADYLRLRPEVTRAFGRAQVLGELRDRARETLRRKPGS
ncbi:MAG: hypothetical protein Kow0013_06580 [Pararhodobacter sp.]